MAAEVSVEGIRKRFGGVTAVDDVHLHVGAGEFFTLLGPSGSGKTTTLRVIAGFERPDAGTVSLDGEDITNEPPYARDVNTVFQDYALFPHMTVAENVAYGLKVKKVPRAERAERVRDVLARVRLADYGGRKPVQLSGGQRQRVALARSIVNRPKVLLLDEPLGALDLKLRQEMQEFLKGLQQELGMTFLYVTHDQEEALTMSDHVAVFNEGRIEQIGTPTEIYERPTTEFVAGFVGTTNILERNGRRFSVRPERIDLQRGGDGSGEPATVVDVVFVGAFSRYLVETFAGERLTVVRQYDGSRIEPGTPVQVGWRAEDAYEIEIPLILDNDGLLNWSLRSLGLPGANIEYSNTAVWIVFSYIWLPFMILPVYAALERIPHSYIEASRDLGGKGFYTLRSIILPLALPGIVAGSIFTFSLTLGDYITPILVGGTSSQFIGNVVYDSINSSQLPFAAAFAVVPVIVMGVYLMIARRLGAFEAL